MSGFALGNYLWGSLIVRTTRQAAVRGAGARAFLGTVLEKKASWEDARQFVAIATFHHETTHLLQDVTSGCGLWDFHLIVKVFQDVNYWTIVRRERNDYFRQLPAVAARLRESLCESGVVLPDGLRAAKHPVVFAQFASGGPGIPQEQLSVEALLEGEAMIHTEALLQQLEMSSLARQIMGDHTELYDVSRASGKYSIAYQQVFQLLAKFVGTADRAKVHALAKPLFLFLADISLAFPPSALIVSSDENRKKWFPTAKFETLVKAIDELSPEDFGSVLASLVTETIDTEAAEAILCKHTEFAGFPRRRVYQAWLKWLKENEIPQLKPAFAMRRRALNVYLRSLKTTIYWRTEWFRSEAEIPWICLTPMGLNWHGSFEIQDPEKAMGALNEHISCLLSYNRERELLMAFAGIRPFICPVGETRLCPAQSPACVSGEPPTDGVAEIPSDEQCSVWNTPLRQDWVKSFRLPRPNRPNERIEHLEKPMFSFDHILNTR